MNSLKYRIHGGESLQPSSIKDGHAPKAIHLILSDSVLSNAILALSNNAFDGTDNHRRLSENVCHLPSSTSSDRLFTETWRNSNIRPWRRISRISVDSLQVSSHYIDKAGAALTSMDMPSS